MKSYDQQKEHLQDILADLTKDEALDFLCDGEALAVFEIDDEELVTDAYNDLAA